MKKVFIFNEEKKSDNAIIIVNKKILSSFGDERNYIITTMQ